MMEVYVPKKNGKWGIVDKNNKVLVDFIYEDIGYDFGPVVVKKEGKWGIIDKKGNVIISFAYDDITRTLSKLFSVKRGGKWGLIDNKENIIQDFKFDKELHITYQDNSKDRFICTESNGNNGILNANGKEIYPAESEDYISFRGNLASVKKNGKYGLINREGREIYPAESEEYIWFDGDVARVKKNGKYGAINKEGRIIYPITEDFIGTDGGMVKVGVSKDGQGYKSGLFDSNGNEILPMKYNDISYRNGVFTVYDGKYGIFNLKGKQILPFEYDKIYIFG